MSISDVLAQYERIREKNEAEGLRRRNEIYKKLPELKNLHLKIYELQKKRIFNAFSSTDLVSKEILALRNTVKDMLIKAGYCADYLDPIYSCSLCLDTGLLENGSRCSCLIRRILEDKLNEAHLTDSGISFEKFNIDIFDSEPYLNGKSQKEEMLYYKGIAESYANDFPDNPPFLILSGGIGLGKTYMAKCIMHRIIERGFTAAYFTAYKLFSLFHKDRLGEDVDLSPIFEVPLLIIDDLGSEPMTKNVTIEYFFNLINERWNAKLHTIIVTNLPLKIIKDHYGERIHSRLMDKDASLKILLKGNDIRH